VLEDAELQIALASRVGAGIGRRLKMDREDLLLSDKEARTVMELSPQRKNPFIENWEIIAQAQLDKVLALGNQWAKHMIDLWDSGDYKQFVKELMEIEKDLIRVADKR